MNKRSFQFARVRIDRALGISRQSAFEVNDLSPGFNLIHGPNGIGKSTLARVLQELIWPGATQLERPSISGTYDIAGARYEIDIDAGHVAIRAPGSEDPAHLSSAGPPENRARYHLSLLDLIVEDDVHFAKAVTEACQGGVDLDAATKALDFVNRHVTVRKLAKEYDSALATQIEVARTQRSFVDDESRLRDLELQRETSAGAQRHINSLESAIRFHEAVKESETLRQQLESFPPELANLKGDEIELLNDLDGEEATLRSRLETAETRLEKAAEQLRSSRIDVPGVSKMELQTLSQYIKSLESSELKISEERRQLSAAKGRRKKCERRISNHISSEQLKSLELVEFPDLSEFARLVNAHRAKQDLLQLKRAWLAEEVTPQTSGDLHAVRDGVTHLSSWLTAARQGSPSESRSLLVWLTVAIGGCLTLALAVLHHPLWCLALLPLVAIGLSTLRRNQGELHRDGEAHRTAYEATGLRAPQQWRQVHVSERLVELNREIAGASLAERKNSLLADLATQESDLTASKTRIQQQATDLESTLGIRIDLSEEWLPLLVQNLSDWQNASTEVGGLLASHSQLTKTQGEQLEEIAQVLAKYDYGAASNLEEAQAQVDDLKSRDQVFQTATIRQQEASDEKEKSLSPALETIQSKRKALFERLGLDGENRTRLEEWTPLLAEYRRVNIEKARIDAIVDEYRLALADCPELIALTAAESNDRLTRANAQQEQLGDLTEEITEIRQNIRRAKAEFKLTDVLSETESAKSALAEAQERSASLLVGGALARWVRQESIEKSRPVVYHRAQEILAKITRGSLSMTLDDKSEPPSFLASSNGASVRPIAELSLGERVQLLFAVRLAFAEQDEIVKLPLFLDETLGTSDDYRVESMIESVIEIAKDGRQVFYFTAQTDEVGKWVAKLSEADVPYQLVDLARVRQRSTSQAKPLLIAQVPTVEIEAPGNSSYDEYGRHLNVASIDPLDSTTGNVHLWHLLDDTQSLYELLKLRISSWGQLKSLSEHADSAVAGVAEESLKRAAAAAHAIEVACQAWRIGRGKPVDRNALLESAVVSDQFMEPLVRLIEQSGGDANSILESLANKEVKRWRQGNTESLREFFAEHEYLTERDALDPEAIRLRVLGALRNEIEMGLIESTKIDAIVHGLPN